MTYRDYLDRADTELKKAGIEDHSSCARLIVCEASGMNMAAVILHEHEEVSEAYVKRFEELLSRRLEREPLEYITGHTSFMGLEIICTPDCLIPSFDTEILAEIAVNEAKKALREAGSKETVRLLDICTGTGCVGISVAKLSGIGKVTLSDISPEVIRVAEKNAAENGVEAELIVSDLFEAIEGKYKLITANPPYIAGGMIETLAPEVSVFEPRLALDGGADGLSFYRRIVMGAPEYMDEGAFLAMEIGDEQAEEVGDMMKERGFEQITVHKDLAGFNRVVSGFWKG
ncbi:MAG: peptide chain release factor N(5)-glutamine methyltransferase [Lachnospiraceae bacterium]|nr:peptide chain release factor N(5)-glutamine methyltransferase [Lachnospiraceae bacterium]